MTDDGGPISGRQGEPTERVTTSQAVARLTRFDGPPEQFLTGLLAVQCRIGSAEAGAILRADPDGKVGALAVHPQPAQGSRPPAWLAQATESAGQVLAGGKSAIKPAHSPDDLYGEPARRHLLLIPLFGGGGGVRGLAVFLVATGDQAVLAARQQRLELTVPLLSLYEMRLTLQQRQGDLHRLRQATETVAVVGEQDRFTAAAMALCNEVASRWQADRVGLGFLKGRYVKLKALSHTEKFSRKMKLVQDIESAMEECIDQDVEVTHPAPADAGYISRAAGELSRRHVPTAVVSLPLRKAGEPIAVLTAERPVERPFNLEQIEALRLACDLCTPRVAMLEAHDRWIGARAAGCLRKGLAALVGPRHTWAKVVAVLVLAAVLFVTFARGAYQAEASFVLEAARRQVIAAPFDGELKGVSGVRPGDPVQEGTELASLRTWELELQLASALAEQASFRAQADLARRDGETAKQQIAEAEAGKVAARITLLKGKIDQAKITSPIDGFLLSGDWHQAIGKPVKTGDALFEVAPAGALWAELSVPEDQVAGIGAGLSGELATASYPDRRVGFTVERVNPVAEVVNQKNVFRVRVRLKDTPSWMRPGMEGVAKVHLGRRSYAWLWTRRLVNWLRMKLWLDI